MQKIVAGVDIGGSHVTVCLVDTEKGKLLKDTYTRISIDPSMAKEDVIQTWAAVIRESFNKAQLPVGNIGIAMPGPFDYEKGISYIKGLHKYERLYGENVKELLAAALGIASSQLLMINDASAYLLGELRCGAAVGYSNVVGITLGTGLGSAAFYDETFEEGDLYCTDYAAGKAEDYLSARWLLATYQQRSGHKLKGVKELAEQVGVDIVAQQTFKAFGENLGRVLVNRYAQQSPEVVIIGGNIAKAWQAFIPFANAAIKEAGSLFLLKQAHLGEEAALIGAAYL